MTYSKLKERVRSAPHHWAVLGVHLHSTAAEVKTAHRKLAREFHPDLNGDPAATHLMAKINDAAAFMEDRLRWPRYLAEQGLTQECGACKGEGCLRKQKGFREVIITQCSACKGAGHVTQSR